LIRGVAVKNIHILCRIGVLKILETEKQIRLTPSPTELVEMDLVSETYSYLLVVCIVDPVQERWEHSQILKAIKINLLSLIQTSYVFTHKYRN
jgi:hypothetical protein